MRSLRPTEAIGKLGEEARQRVTRAHERLTEELRSYDPRFVADETLLSVAIAVHRLERGIGTACAATHGIVDRVARAGERLHHLEDVIDDLRGRVVGVDPDAIRESIGAFFKTPRTKR